MEMETNFSPAERKFFAEGDAKSFDKEQREEGVKENKNLENEGNDGAITDNGEEKKAA